MTLSSHVPDFGPLVREFTLACDAVGCPSHVRGDTGAAVLALALHTGWEWNEEPGKPDYCPACRKED